MNCQIIFDNIWKMEYTNFVSSAKGLSGGSHRIMGGLADGFFESWQCPR